MNNVFRAMVFLIASLSLVAFGQAPTPPAGAPSGVPPFPGAKPGGGPGGPGFPGGFPAGMVMGSRSPKKFHVLVLMKTTGFHHDSTSDAAAAIYKMGKDSGLWDTEFATDFSLVNAKPASRPFAGFQPVGLNDFDAVVLDNTTGNWGLSAEDRAAFLNYIKAGHGVVGIHAALDANADWPEYTEMIGGIFGGHPWNVPATPVFDFPLINEQPDFPIVAALPKHFRKQDELYVPKADSFSRDKVDVLLRLDETGLDWAGKVRSAGDGRDAAVAWVKMYGQGRVFYSSLGHTKESWSDPDILHMYLEAVKWVLDRTSAPVQPHEKR